MDGWTNICQMITACSRKKDMFPDKTPKSVFISKTIYRYFENLFWVFPLYWNVSSGHILVTTCGKVISNRFYFFCCFCCCCFCSYFSIRHFTYIALFVPTRYKHQVWFGSSFFFLKYGEWINIFLPSKWYEHCCSEILSLEVWK